MQLEVIMNAFIDHAEYEESRIPDSVRKEVYSRDNNRCQISGRIENLSMHHILKASDNGAAKAHNLILVNREVHDWLHFARIPEKVYEAKNYFILSRMNVLRDFMLIKVPPKTFETAYGYTRAMFDAIDKLDPEPPKNKFLTFTVQYPLNYDFQSLKNVSIGYAPLTYCNDKTYYLPTQPQYISFNGTSNTGEYISWTPISLSITSTPSDLGIQLEKSEEI